LSTFFIVFDHSDLDALKFAQTWAIFGRSLGSIFIIGSSSSTDRRILYAESDQFDFFYVSDGDESLLHAPGLILDQHSSFISYDFEDLRSLWKGRIGQIWSMPAKISSQMLLMNEHLIKFGGSIFTDFILRYDGPAGLDIVDEMAKFMVDALQPNQYVISAWQTQDNQNDGRLELCVIEERVRSG